MPGVVLFSARLLVELLLTPVRALRRLLGGDEREWDEPAPAPVVPEPVAPEPVAPEPVAPPPAATPRRRARRRAPARAEPTRGQVAALREATREAETGGADSVGAEVHVAEPWPGYEDMSLDDVLGRLQNATEVELAVVRAYERAHEARQAVLLAAGDDV
jgi:hypothetical protein